MNTRARRKRKERNRVRRFLPDDLEEIDMDINDRNEMDVSGLLCGPGKAADGK